MNKTQLAIEKRRTAILGRRSEAAKALEVIEKKYGLRDQDGTPHFSSYYSSTFKQSILKIPSVDDRCEAVRLHREITTCSNELQDAGIERSRADLDEMQRYGTLAKELVPIVVGIFFVWLGSQIDGVIGAIGGAVVGIFAGLSYIRTKDAEREFFVKLAQDDLESEIREKEQHYPLRYLFTDEDETA